MKNLKEIKKELVKDILLRLPKQMLVKIDRAAKETNLPRIVIIRHLLEAGLKEYGVK